MFVFLIGKLFAAMGISLPVLRLSEDIFDELSDSLQWRAKKTSVSDQVAVEHRSFVVLGIALVAFYVRVVDCKYSWAIKVELLSLALVKDHYVLNLSEAVPTFQADEKGQKREGCDCSRQSLQNDVPL